MEDEPHFVAASSGPSNGRSWQFRLRTALSMIAFCAFLLAIARVWPTAMLLAALWGGFVLAFWGFAGMVTWPIWFAANPRQEQELVARCVAAISTPWSIILYPKSSSVRSTLLWSIAVLYSFLFVTTGPYWRSIGWFLNLSMWDQTPLQRRWDWESCFRRLSNPAFYSLKAFWQLWDLTHWWLLFGLLSIVVAATLPFRKQPERLTPVLHRFLAFVPWFAVLEFGFYFFTWIEDRSVAPEPGTMWTYSLDRPFAPLADESWLGRALLPTSLVSLAYFRHVAETGWISSMILSAALVPIAICFSAAWDQLFTTLELFQLIDWLGLSF